MHVMCTYECVMDGMEKMEWKKWTMQHFLVMAKSGVYKDASNNQAMVPNGTSSPQHAI